MKHRVQLTIYVVFLIATSLRVSANEVCPAIDCDCDSLPKDAWVSTCTQYESVIKQRCADNANTPADYCLVHGLNAMPLPLSLSLGELGANTTTDVSETRENAEAIRLTMAGYLDEAKRSEQQNQYGSSLERLKLIDALVERVFEQQRLIEIALIEKNEPDRRIRSSWLKHTRQDREYAENLASFGDALTASISSATTEKQKKIYRILAQKTYRIAGKQFEQVGHSFGSAGKHKKAADLWKEASSISEKLAQINRDYGGKPSSVKFSEFQTAARLHRASYHWLLGKDEKNANRTLQASQPYMDREGQRNIELIVNSETVMEQEQAISER